MNEIINAWKKNHNELIKLQWVYAATGLVLVVLAGLVGLLDRTLAYVLLDVVRVIAVIFAANFVVWAVIGNFVTPTVQAASKKATKPRK